MLLPLLAANSAAQVGETFSEKINSWWQAIAIPQSKQDRRERPQRRETREERNATTADALLLAHNDAEYNTWLQRRKESIAPLGIVDHAFKYKEGEGLTWLWDLFQPAWVCPERTRIGRISDGGKVLCSVRRLNAMKQCTVVGFGIGRPIELSFEAELLQRTNCSIVLADPTVDLNEVRTHREWRSMFEGASAGRLKLAGVAIAPTDGHVTLRHSNGALMKVQSWSLERHMRQAGVSHVAALKVSGRTRALLTHALLLTYTTPSIC